jgi:hypothetical protein
MTDIAATEAIPDFCPSCSDGRQPYQRFLFDRGTADAHVVWECDHCGDSGTRVVSPEFVFARTDPHSFNIS